MLKDKEKWTSRENTALIDRTELNRTHVGDSRPSLSQNCIYIEIRFTLLTQKELPENTISDFWSLKPTEMIMITKEDNITNH